MGASLIMSKHIDDGMHRLGGSGGKEPDLLTRILQMPHDERLLLVLRCGKATERLLDLLIQRGFDKTEERESIQDLIKSLIGKFKPPLGFEIPEQIVKDLEFMTNEQLLEAAEIQGLLCTKVARSFV